MSMALSGGSLLASFQGKRVYQPIWQIIYVYCPPGQSGGSGLKGGGAGPGSGTSQMLVSDGRFLTYHVALHPQCSVTYQKSQWKNQNNGRTPEDVVSTYRFPYIKVIDYLVKTGDKTTVLFLSKIKLMGWEKCEKMPDILKTSDAEVVLGNGEVILRSREGLENFDEVPLFDICDTSIDCENNLTYENGKVVKNDDDFFGRTYKPTQISPPDDTPIRYCQTDLLTGDLAALGPYGLDILTLCDKCELLTYQAESRTTSFKPPAQNLRDNLSEILPRKTTFEFCSCDDENEQFRKEFQNKCMVVNQDTGPGADKKVQCILVSKEQRCQDHPKVEDEVKNSNVTNNEKNCLMTTADSIIPLGGRVARVSGKLRLCERCGVEETQMSACRQCAKVWYCSPACKRADVKQHSTVCRAYITVRRYCEEREEFARRLREPEDGCGTCGFWRDTLEDCAKCGQVAYCSYRCKDKAAEKHRPVCEAYMIVGSYRKRLLLARSQEVD